MEEALLFSWSKAVFAFRRAAGGDFVGEIFPIEDVGEVRFEVVVDDEWNASRKNSVGESGGPPFEAAVRSD